MPILAVHFYCEPMGDALLTFFKRLKWFLVPFAVFFVAGLVFLTFSEKGSEVLWLNSVSKPAWDGFFLFITDAGLATLPAVVAAVLLIFNFRWSMVITLSLCWSGLITYVTKNWLLPGCFRPFHHFYYDDFTRFIHDAPLIYFNSFPSGHSMAIFAFCAALAYLIGKTLPSILLFFFALLVGVSRIYLLQHFGADVVAGSFLGIVAAFLAVLILDFGFHIGNKKGFGRGLKDVFGRK